MCSHWPCSSAKRELYPYPSEIRIIDTRNRRTSGKDEITISVAEVNFRRYGTDIQKEVYYKHLKTATACCTTVGGTENIADVAKVYRTGFRQTLAVTHSTRPYAPHAPQYQQHDVVLRGWLRKLRQSELSGRNERFLSRGKALQFVEQYPPYHWATKISTITCLRWNALPLWGTGRAPQCLCHGIPETPVAPEKEEYDTTEEYEAAYKEYEQDFSNYMEKCKSIHEQRIDTGELTFYICIGQKEITLCYMAKCCRHNADMAGRKNSPGGKVEQQDKRNK